MADSNTTPPARRPRAPRRPAGPEEGTPALPVTSRPQRAARPKPQAAPPVPAPAAPEPPQPPPAAPFPEPAPARGGLYEALWKTGLLTVGSIARRELTAYFVSPVGYVVSALLIEIVTLVGYLFPLSQQLAVSTNQTYYWFVYLMMFFAPLYTMRLLAEERRSGTLEVLLTSPVRDWEVVVGKWLAAWIFFVLTTLFTLVYAVLIIRYQPALTVIRPFGVELHIGNVDFGPIISGYLGLLLVGAAFLAIGIWASSLTSNQIIAAVIGIGALLGSFYVLGLVGSFVPGATGEFLQYLGGGNRFTSFYQGRLVLKDAVYFLSLTAGGLFLAVRVLESRRWR